MVCGGCSLRAVLLFFFGAFGDSFGIFSGATTGRDSGAVSGNPAPSSVTFALSNQREMLVFRSSIAAHPPIAKLAERAIETSATRARIDVAIVGVAGSIVDVGAGARMALQGCHTVNSAPPAGLPCVGRRPRTWTSSSHVAEQEIAHGSAGTQRNGGNLLSSHPPAHCAALKDCSSPGTAAPRRRSRDGSIQTNCARSWCRGLAIHVAQRLLGWRRRGGTR
jgi:hypothetical protein